MPRDGKPPYFPFYPDDFAGDGKVEVMTTEEVGAYILLLCKAWREEPVDSIPDDDRVLARWARLSDERWAACRERVRSCFTSRKDGRLYQMRLRREFEKFRTNRRRLSEAGSLGADRRWGGHSQANGQARDGPSPNDGKSASASASSSDSDADAGGASVASPGLGNIFGVGVADATSHEDSSNRDRHAHADGMERRQRLKIQKTGRLKLGTDKRWMDVVANILGLKKDPTDLDRKTAEKFAFLAIDREIQPEQVTTYLERARREGEFPEKWFQRVAVDELIGRRLWDAF